MHIVSLSKSRKIGKLPKTKCYGHYCNLCRKYGYDRVKYKYFKPEMIVQMEYKYLNQKYRPID